uniref:hypothetical protein n=1 Tax=Flavobacterium sp. TaxID=239 RepID=UPI00404A74FC
MDLKRGIVCSLTDDFATFNETCNDFAGDDYQVRKLIQSKDEEKRLADELERSGLGSKVTAWDIIRIIFVILGAILALVRLFRNF